jgi:hypothetical protein
MKPTMAMTSIIIPMLSTVLEYSDLDSIFNRVPIIIVTSPTINRIKKVVKELNLFIFIYFEIKKTG